MALKTPKPTHLSEPLTGEDAERLVEYVENPTPPDGHAEFIASADEAFRAHYSPEPANELFEQ